MGGGKTRLDTGYSMLPMIIRVVRGPTTPILAEPLDKISIRGHSVSIPHILHAGPARLFHRGISILCQFLHLGHPWALSFGGVAQTSYLRSTKQLSCNLRRTFSEASARNPPRGAKPKSATCGPSHFFLGTMGGPLEIKGGTKGKQLAKNGVTI